jgi:ubiquitin-activating enzyme E1
LAGVKSVTLFDRSLVTVQDLCSQFFLHAEDIDKPKDQVTAPRLAELNSYVPVSVMEGELNDHSIKHFSVL